MVRITASILYSFIACPHRVRMDAFQDPTTRDAVSPFVELLWERGTKFERETIGGLNLPFTDLSLLSLEEKERATLEAMRRGDKLIYGGRIAYGDLLGDPDLLRREGAGYVAGDIKSGAGEEGEDGDDKKPKKHYAVQLALYTDVLSKLGVSAGRRAFVWDIHGEEVAYDFDAPQGVRTPTTLWQFYESTLATVRPILLGEVATRPTAASICKLCHWYSACRKAIQEADDLSQVPELGRSRRDAMVAEIPTATDLAAINPDGYITKNKTRFPGVGPDMLRRFHERAKLLKSNGRPYLTQPVRLPLTEQELHFDLEVDPLRDHVYLHGFVVRDPARPDGEFVSFVARQPNADAERQAFAEAIGFFRSSPRSTVFVYSAYERTTYRKLQEKYPDVVNRDEIDALFDESRTVDLYGVVRSSTVWPTWDHSIKTLAKYLGFAWRDSNPSGAASIEWYDRYVESSDEAMLQRILAYNEDDCRAMIVLLDALREMS